MYYLYEFKGINYTTDTCKHLLLLLFQYLANYENTYIILVNFIVIKIKLFYFF